MIRAMILAVFCSGAALAQNSDLGFLLGASVRSAVVSPGRVEDKVGASFQINYAGQIHESAAGRLYVELPLHIAAEENAFVGNTVRASDTITVFFTPGVRFHHAVHPRIALYAAAGGGVASAAGSLSVVGRGVVQAGSARSTSVALGFGGGVDLRLTRLLSLRGEGRDFLTKGGLGGAEGHHHFFFTVGLGFHF